MKNRSSMHTFFNNAWLSYIALFTWTHPRAYIACKILLPLTQMLFFVYLGVSATGQDSMEFYIIGNAIQMVAVNGIYGVTSVIGTERYLGTLIYLFGSPANRMTVLLGRIVFNVLDGISTACICLLWGLILGLDLSQANLLILLLTILITTVSTCGFGLVLGSLSLLSVNIMFLNNTVYFLLLVFSGANLPYDKMPGWILMVSNYLPITRGIQAARLIVQGAQLNQIWQLLLGELGVGLVYAILGFILFQGLELAARQFATFEGV